MTTTSARLSDLARIVHREVVLLAVLSAIAAAAFLLTQWAATATRMHRESEAAAWYGRGLAQLAEKRTTDAVVALGRAAARRPDDWDYAKVLAGALLDDGQASASRHVLLQWRRQRPDDVDVNTQLARLEAGSGDATAAIAYYESALHGRWPDAASSSRLDVRRELIRFELARGLTAQALSHTLILAANSPDESAAHVDVARLFLAAGDVARAQDHFARALHLKPGDVDARVGATESAFARGDYARTLVEGRGLTDPRSVERMRLAAAVVANDPLEPRVPAGERRRRLSSAVRYATTQLGACRRQRPDASTLAKRTAAALADALTAFRVDDATPDSRPSDTTERGLHLVFQALEAVRRQCPPLETRGDALVRAARRHGASE